MAKRTKDLTRRAPGVLVNGLPGCVHVETVAYDDATCHLLGRCRLCHRIKDYTILQGLANIEYYEKRGIYKVKNYKGGKRAHGLIEEEVDALLSY